MTNPPTVEAIRAWHADETASIAAKITAPSEEYRMIGVLLSKAPEPTPAQPMRRFMDAGDAGRLAWARVDEMRATLEGQSEVRELKGQMGTGPSSDDWTLSLWLNHRPVLVFSNFRDAMNYSVLIEWQPTATPAQGQITPEAFAQFLAEYDGWVWKAMTDDPEEKHDSRPHYRRKAKAILQRLQGGQEVTKTDVAGIVYASFFGGTSDPTLDEHAQGISLSIAQALLTTFSITRKGTFDAFISVFKDQKPGA